MTKFSIGKIAFLTKIVIITFTSKACCELAELTHEKHEITLDAV